MSSSRYFALVRVSTDRQSVHRQIDAVCAAGVEEAHIVIEHGVSGDDVQRDGLVELLRVTRAGDEVVVAELSRLGRRTAQVLELVETLTATGVTVRCLSPTLTFDGSPISRLLLTLLAAVAELELETIRERTREGLAAARARGRIGGRPVVLTEAQRRAIIRMRADGMSAAELAGAFEVSRRSVYRVLSAGNVADGETAGDSGAE